VQGGRVVLDVLEHLEGAHRVEDLRGLKCGEVAAHHLAGAHAAQGLLRGLAGELVGLDADVAVARSQPGAEGAAARSDLEDRLDPVEPRKRSLDQVVAEPGVEREGREGAVDPAILESVCRTLTPFTAGASLELDDRQLRPGRSDTVVEKRRVLQPDG
jgi:hypothetical protein